MSVAASTIPEIELNEASNKFFHLVAPLTSMTWYKDCAGDLSS